MEGATRIHTLQDTMNRIFSQLSEDDQYILIADANTLLKAAQLREKFERKKGFTIIQEGGKNDKD